MKIRIYINIYYIYRNIYIIYTYTAYIHIYLLLRYKIVIIYCNIDITMYRAQSYESVRRDSFFRGSIWPNRALFELKNHSNKSFKFVGGKKIDAQTCHAFFLL